MNERRRSPLGLILLLNLLQGPSHAYRLHKLLEQTGKDRIVNVKTRASVYQTIERLVRDGLIEPAGTSSTAGYPDRVEYAITDQGRAVTIDWLRELLGSTRPDSSGFIVALSTIFALTPDDARRQLQTRRERLTSQLAEAEQAISGPQVPPALPRLFLLDEHYRRAMLTAELAWTEALITDLADGHLNWTREWLDEVAARFTQNE
jgi:DNA-binding PadR family transcriptional regulator